LDGLEGLLNLKTLDVSKNLITNIDYCAAIKLLPALTSFDVRDNQISNHEAIIPFFSEM
jgi:Leucine-rich repeat (LRR) protein